MGKTFKLERFYHTILNARDLQKSVDFYVMLGFEILHDRRDVKWPDNIAAMFGLKKADGGGVLLRVPVEGDEVPTMLDIIHWREPQADFPDPAKVETTVPRVFALKVSDAKAAYEELSAKGYKFTPGGLYTPAGASMFVHTAHVYDPDGNIVELIQLKAGARHSMDFQK